MKSGDAIKTWEVDLDGVSHHLRMQHNFWSGEKQYFIDDELIEHVAGSLGASAAMVKEVPFTIGAHRGRFEHRAVGRVVFYDLYIDDRKIEGMEQHALRMPVWVFVLLMLLLFLIAYLSMNS